MIELLREAARQSPDRLAVVSDRGRTTYAELGRAADSVAGWLRDKGVRRFAILDPDPAVVVSLLAGAAAVGAEPCVYPLAATDAHINELAERFGHEMVVTTRSSLAAATVVPSDLLTAVSSSTTPGEAPASQPILVLTTGTTTGKPRGARHEWGRLLRITRKIQPAPDHRWLLAYGLNQFGGVQILIHVLTAQSTLVAGASFQPRDGLAAMREYGVTHASGTPTFWRFLLNELRSNGGETPALQQITLSGEAVPGALLQRLREAFPGAHLSQVYGATEFGHPVTVRDGLPGLPLSLLSEGDEVNFKVEDGQLWYRSRAAMLGYHGEQTYDVDEWRPTGDLVEVVGDRVEFRGRNTDVINVGGVKVHPLPVEDRISSIPGVALARVFGRPNALAGAIVAVEAVLAEGHDAESVDRAIREACADLPPAARPRSIRFVDTIVTTGNKLDRKVLK